MGSKVKEGGGRGLSRRDFLKVSAAGAAGLAATSWAVAEPAFAVQGMTEGTDFKVFHTTCPYCSASCGQLVAVKNGAATIDGVAYADGEVLDVYGDGRSPINLGGLCAKGAGAFQHVTNPRRLGAFATNPVNSTFSYNATYGTSGVAYKRTGDGAWGAMALDTAMDEIAAALKTARDSHQVPAASNGYNSKGVAFLGCSHMNNEQNYTYRKLIAQFGSSNTEHQARI